MFLRFSEKLKSSAGDFRVSSLVFEKVPYLGRGGGEVPEVFKT